LKEAVLTTFPLRCSAFAPGYDIGAGFARRYNGVYAVICNRLVPEVHRQCRYLPGT